MKKACRTVRAFVGLQLILAATLFVLPATTYAGFGITPPYVRNDRLTQGSTFTQEILLVRGDPLEDLKAEVTINVPGVDSWFSIDKGNEFLLPAGEEQVPMLVTVRVPNDAPYDRYKGSIRIRTTSPNPASGVSLALGAQIDVDIRVVDEIRDFEVKRVKISETEEPKRIAWLEYPGKISFSMAIENTGNADVAPSSVQFEIFDKRGNVVLETIRNTNSIETVEPFETKEVVAFLPTKLPAGAYLVKYSIYRFDDDVKRTGELTLSVLPRGTIAGYVGYGIDGLSMRDKLTVLIPIALLIALLLLLVIVMRLRLRNKRRRQRLSNERDEQSGPPTGGRVHTPQSPPPRRTAPLPDARAHGVVDLSQRRRRGE